MFAETIYIKIDKNFMMAKNLSAEGHWQSQHAGASFTNNRLLVANFSIAQTTLSTLLQAVKSPGFLPKKLTLVMQPMQMIEGGLSEVEQRVYKELGLGAGAQHVYLHTGNELNDQDALALAKSKN